MRWFGHGVVGLVGVECAGGRERGVLGAAEGDVRGLISQEMGGTWGRRDSEEIGKKVWHILLNVFC